MKLRPQKNDIVRLKDNLAQGYDPQATRYLKPGDTVTVLDVISGHFDRNNPNNPIEVVVYRVKQAGFRDIVTGEAWTGKMFLFLHTDIDEVIGVAPDACKCNLWAGCTCGVVKREKEIASARE